MTRVAGGKRSDCVWILTMVFGDGIWKQRVGVMDVWWEGVPQVMDGQGEACRAHSSQTGGCHNEMEKRTQKFREALKVSDCLESLEQNFELNTILNQKPVKLLKDKHDVVNGRAGDGASSWAQEQLKFMVELEHAGTAVLLGETDGSD